MSSCYPLPPPSGAMLTNRRIGTPAIGVRSPSGHRTHGSVATPKEWKRGCENAHGPVPVPDRQIGVGQRPSVRSSPDRATSEAGRHFDTSGYAVMSV